MYIRWKVLLGLGTAFWLLLCLCDYLPVKHIDHILTEKDQKHYVEIEKQIISKVKPSTKKDGGGIGFVKGVLWNLVAFASTISVCFLLKFVFTRLNILNNQSLLLRNNKLGLRKTNSSKIPIPITSKSSSTDIHIEGATINAEELQEAEYNKSCPNLCGSQEIEEKSKINHKNNKNIWSIRIMEKHCAKLREEMVNLHATSQKEHVTVSKKIKFLMKEKRSLTKQFNAIAKENRSLRQQLNDVIEERSFLIKRLECATKEMQTATKNKQVTITKLDEAIANAETLKTNLEQIKRDKIALEDKIIILDAEYKRLKEEVELHRQKEIELERRSNGNKPSGALKECVDRHNLDSTEKNVVTQTEDNEYVSRSEEDIKKVHQKLLILEKSLEHFKLRHESNDKSDEANKIDSVAESEFSKCNETELNALCLLSQYSSKITVEEQPSGFSICTELDCPLEHRECLNAECFLKRKAEEVSSFEDEMNLFLKYKDYISLKKQFSTLHTPVSDDRLSAISEKAASTGDESGVDWNEPNQRIVTHSAAFQKFFREIIEAQEECGSTKNYKETFE